MATMRDYGDPSSHLPIGKNLYWPALVLILLAAVSFWPTFTADFMWDDHEMILKNQRVRQITSENLRHVLTSDVFDQKGDA